MKCGKAGGVVTTVPVFHVTPGAFILHINNRSNRDQLRTSWKDVDPTMISGVCGGRYYPYPEDLQSMRDGDLSLMWTLLEQNNQTLAKVSSAGIIFHSMLTHLTLPNSSGRISIMASDPWIPITVTT